jgi:hypothetical protein
MGFGRWIGCEWGRSVDELQCVGRSGLGRWYCRVAIYFIESIRELSYLVEPAFYFIEVCSHQGQVK